MIGSFCIATFPYYDMESKTNRFKQRPMLVIGLADTSDLVTLPVSSVTVRRNLHMIYDIEILPGDYPLMGLT